MKKELKKMKKNGGFTLMEMLIVVAIIAILVAISIPIMNSSLNKARIATDAANERAAKAEAVVEYLSGEKTGTFYYDAATGQLADKADGIEAYGKCSDHKDSGKSVLTVTISDAGKVTLKWGTSTVLHNGNVE
jgi:type IV pilus assembly protein PilA